MLRATLLLGSVMAASVLVGAFVSSPASARALVGDCAPGQSGYLLGSANAAFALNGYRQAHLHDYRPGTTQSPNNYTIVRWRVYNSGVGAGIQLDLVHNYLGQDVLNWQTTSSSGVVTNGSYGVVPAEFWLRVYHHASTWDATISYGVSEYPITSVVPTNAGSAFLQLAGFTDVETYGACNTPDMRFDGGAPGSGSYTACGPRLPVWGSPPPLNCSKDVQIRFFYG
jgi:hypothetical protein